MPRISEINPETAPEAIQKIIADHLADGHALTAEKRTLLHNAAAFNAVEAGSYALDDELQRLIGKLRRIFVFLIRQNSKRNRRLGKPAVRVQ